MGVPYVPVLGVVGTDDTLDVPGPITVLKRRS